jgi:LCP family protein required for cell wall assembly
MVATRPPIVSKESPRRWRARVSALLSWRRSRPWVLLGAGSLAVVVSVAAVWGINLLLQFDEHPVRAIRSLDQPSDFAKHPRNVLLLGSDTRAGLSEEQQAAFGSEETVEGERSDTIILMHIDPRREKAIVVHLPRDLRVTIPGHGVDRINAAYELGGPDLVVRTVRDFTGLPIHNYIQVNLAGFQRLVDALGGVRLCVDRPMFDDRAKLSLPREGCYLLDGETALAFVRARNIEGDIIPDFSRIARQQQFMRAMLNRLTSLGALLDTQVIEEAVSNVTTDDKLEGADLILLGQKLRELAREDPSGARSLDFRVVPSIPQTIGDTAYVVPQQPETDRLFEALEAGRPLGRLGLSLAQTLPSPGVINVRVLDAGIGSSAEEVEALLRRAGFVVLDPGEAPAATTSSEILYGPRMRPRSEVVAGYLEGLPRREVSADLLGNADVAVVIGDDWTEVTAQ